MLIFLLTFSALLTVLCIFLGYTRATAFVRLEICNQNVEKLTRENDELKKTNKNQDESILNLHSKIAELKAQRDALEFAQDSMQVQFENLAHKIFEDSSQKLSQKSLADIQNVLAPLKTKISDFEKRIEDSFNADIKERYSLSREITKMATQTEKMIEEADKLTRTLRGENKAQGLWGELVLAKILECSGLEQGRDYSMQQRLENNSIPDVIINLPDNKHIIIDAKTSLKHYDLYLNTQKKENLDLFLKSIKAHVKNLAGKEYQDSAQLCNPGFVLMFIPIESAYSMALLHDPDLRIFALQNKIIITSPNSLIAMLQTVASVWKIVEQNKNAAEIARKAGAMYDKMVMFVDELKKVGSAIIQAEKCYTNAMARLKDGSGNLIRRTEALKKMGLETTKQIDEDML